jgi:hypothetical protein
LNAKQPYLQPQDRTNREQQGAAAALVAMGAGAPGIEGLSLGTKRIEEVETNTMGGSPRAEDDGSGRYRTRTDRRSAMVTGTVPPGDGAPVLGSRRGNSGGVRLDLTELLEASGCSSGAPMRRIESTPGSTDGLLQRQRRMVGQGYARPRVAARIRRQGQRFYRGASSPGVHGTARTKRRRQGHRVLFGHD